MLLKCSVKVVRLGDFSSDCSCTQFSNSAESSRINRFASKCKYFFHNLNLFFIKWLKNLVFIKIKNNSLQPSSPREGVAIKFWNYIKFLLKAFFGVRGGITFFYRHWLPPLKLKLRRPWWFFLSRKVCVCFQH